MQKFARFIAAILLIPFLWAECLTIFDIMPGAFSAEFPFLSPELVATVAGIALWLVLALFVPVSNWFYVLGHELTHAAWGLATFSKVSKISVTSRGGFCCIENPGMFTTLAPYFIPFYLVVLLALRAIAGIWVDMAPYALPWFAALGFAYGFHVTNTVTSIVTVDQPDIRVYGRFFSCVFILSANLLFVGVGFALLDGTPVSELASIAADRVAGTYAAAAAEVARVAVWLAGRAGGLARG